MWQWVAVMALVIGSALPGQPEAAPIEIDLDPNSFAQQRWMHSTAPVKAWSSRVGKGKSFGVCMDAIDCCIAIPGYKYAITRFTRVSLRESILETLIEILGPDLFGKWWSESKHTLAFPPVRCDDGKVRRSKIVLFGWQDPQEALSTQYGRIAMEQAEQLERQHLQIAKTRIRHGDDWMLARCEALGIKAQQIGLVCNADDPEHWINQDFEIADRGARIEYNPRTGRQLYEVILSQATDNNENMTPEYLEMLETLDGVHYERYVLGLWVRAEGLVFGRVWNPSEHILQQRPDSWAKWRVRSGPEAGKIIPPPNLTRHRWMDFGVNHPFTCTWGAELPDRTVIAYREISGRGKSPSEWAEQIVALERAEVEAWRAAIEDEDEARVWRPYLSGFHCASSISDTDLGWRTELDRCGVWTRVIDKNADDGITGRIAVITAALRENQIKFVSDLLVEPCPELQREKLPTSIFQEMGRYKWRSRPASSSEAGEGRFDVPVDRDNHRIDPLGYFLSDYRGGPGPGRVW